ncbi:MAG: hypothetical protein ABIS29_02655 [Vicinamibacterales bacterium]
MNVRPFALTVAICCTTTLYAQKQDPYKHVDSDVRLDAIRHSQVWMPGDIASNDMKAGPQDVPSFPPEAVANCEYVEEKVTGTPKFNCAISPDDKVRVKYGPYNGEVYAEAAATRLLWSLGFGADRVYPVTVLCHGCPEFPSEDYKRSKETRRYPSAIIERKMPGDEITVGRTEGWSWVELSFVDQTAGGAPLAHRDALKLLAAMIQHTDNKPQQQRLVCLDRVKSLQPEPAVRCKHAFMMINDLGKTFGRATMSNGDLESAVNFKAWSSTPIWKDEKACVANLSKSFTGSLEHPKISEDGRKFLSGLLAQLTDQQLRDLFEVAHFSKRDPKVSVDDWVRVFKEKRDAIANARCTNPVL